LEYRLLKRLNQTPGRYILVPTLGADVWGDAAVSRNAVQRVVSALRRKLARFAGLEIDGDEAGHYRLILPN
jgi:DNA-binding winged helix-turn-helix (wHTH) protein